ncbi:uncharacterized protein [Temnothorax nylanderi]|uniref:uncharacterized protein n=1 Tax=Temnothorax nylanderi TaxID=102681 RepID=UPI003A853031
MPSSPNPALLSPPPQETEKIPSANRKKLYCCCVIKSLLLFDDGVTGKARHIGVTGYPVSVLKECVEKSNINIASVLSYSRLTLIDDTLLEYVPFFKKHKIDLINAATPCMGLLTNNGPPSWHPASDETKKQCANAAQYCKEHDVELGKLAIWHSMQYTDIDTNLIGIQNTKQLKMNLDVMRNGITEKEKALLQEIQEKFLSTVKNQHWEGKEIRTYREATKKNI